MKKPGKAIAFRCVLLVLAAMMVTTPLAGCTSAPTTSGTTASTTVPMSSGTTVSTTAKSTQPAVPYAIDIMTRFHLAESPAADNMIVKEIEKLANVKLDISWIALGAYDEKMNATIAAGTYPSVMLITGNAQPSPVEVQAVRAGMFWCFGDYMMDYENLKTLNPAAIDAASIDGKLWGNYRTRPLARRGWFYRTDWAKKLGLNPPANPEEMYQMIKAFVKNDPDGNGKDDTGGLAQENTLSAEFAALGPYYNLPNQYGVVNKKITPMYFMDGYMTILKWTKRLFDEGLMNKDFPAVGSNPRDELLAGGKYGFCITSIDKGIKAIGTVQQSVPAADFTVGQTFTDDKDAYLWANPGFDGKFYISTKKVKDEASVKKIMEYFNAMRSPAICNLINYGIEGKHYTKVSATEITIDAAQKVLFTKEVEVMEQLGFRQLDRVYIAKTLQNYDRQYTEAFIKNDGICIPNPVQPLNSETYNEKGADLDLIITDANNKFVTGKIDEAGWKAEMDRWLKTGGQNMIDEYQAEYDKK